MDDPSEIGVNTGAYDQIEEAMTYISVTIGICRVALILASFKWPKLCRWYFFFENIALMVDMTFPKDYGTVREEYFRMYSSELKFRFMFDFWGSLLI